MGACVSFFRGSVEIVDSFLFPTIGLPITNFDTVITIDVLEDLTGCIVGLFFDFGGDDFRNKVGIGCGVFQMHTGAIVMLIDKCFDNKLGPVILAGIQAPLTTVVFATDVELVRVSLDEFRWEAVFNGVGCAGVLQRVDGVPFGPDFEGVHGDS